MVDVFLILVITVAFLILVVGGVYFLVYYQHPDDKNTAYFPKIVVLGAFCIAGGTVLGLPLDVANNAGYAGCDGYDTKLCGGLNMELFWDIFFWLIPIWIFALIPFSVFYYEAEDVAPPPTPPGDAEQPAPPDKKQRSKLSQALCNLAVVSIFVALLQFLTYWFLGYTHIPVRTYQGGTIMEGARPAGVVFQTTPRRDENGTVLHFTTHQMEDIQPNDAMLLRLVKVNDRMDNVSFRTSVSTFYAGLMAFVGWFFFALFGGIGLGALPMSGILAYTRRPQKLTPEEMDDLKTSLQDRVNEMVEIGEQLKREREDKSKITAKQGFFAKLCPSLFQKRSGSLREFKAAVHLLQEDVEDFAAYETSNEKYNPLYPYFALLGGILASIFSLCWVLQTVLYTLPPEPVTGFLNNLFEWFDGWFPLFGTLAVAFFVLYLLLCTIQGCFVFGLRFLCLSFYPMRVGQTYMSSFLFNMSLVLLSALPVVQFAVVSFEDYAQNSTIHQIFVVQIEYLDFFVFFYKYNVFVYIFLVISLLTGIYMFCKRKGSEGAEMRDRLKSRARSSADPEPAPMAPGGNSSAGETGEETFEDEPEYEDSDSDSD